MDSISVIPGDGIGPEVVESALQVLDALDIGLSIDVLDHVHADRYRSDGLALSEADLARVSASSAILLGAIGQPGLEGTDYVRGVLLRLRHTFDLYANCRPVRLWHDRLSPLRDPTRRAVDCMVVRENTEGLYSGIGGNLRTSSAQEVAIDADINTWHGVSRILDFAFSTARREVCLVDKANAVRAGGRLWQECWRRTAERHPETDIRHLYIDAAAMKLVSEPHRFDVIVASNSYGDILSDLAAALAGGIGLAPSASLNPETGFGLFEPVHGSAPDIAGKGTANPFACLLTAGLLISHLGYSAEAAAIDSAVALSIAAGRVTPDLGGSLSTREATRAVLAAL
ncbi:isocitrate/isopropylmalate dehydrogenase family protein [Streptomyces sp. NPDC052114]|uniref:isocitrate/isopropylmalate dehydrogenase family protein n=1 Tax=unclassified Streptomyces TaxID=2593676 RepID=UPI00341803E9